MPTPTPASERRRTISFSRLGPSAFRGTFTVRGDRFEDFELTSSLGRIPQDACDAVAVAKAHLEQGGPRAFERAVEVLEAVSSGIVADWPF